MPDLKKLVRDATTATVIAVVVLFFILYFTAW